MPVGIRLCLARNRIAIAAVLAWLAVPSARADEGRIEINQTAASTGGVTPGDTPGFPITLSTAGSYVLSSNLVVSGLNVSAIRVTAQQNVSIDLNGFTIQGACPASGCSAGAGTGRGIDAGSTTGVALSFGRVVGFASDGISAGANALISEVHSRGHGGVGIGVGADSLVADSRVFDNANVGIVATSSIIRACSAGSNLDGIQTTGQSTILDSTSLSNARNGILVAGNNSKIEGNIVSSNGADGIVVPASGALVTDNLTSANVAGGIALGTSGSVQRNLSAGNSIGLYLSPDLGGNPAAYHLNSVVGNSVATVTLGIGIAPNGCNGNQFCP